MHISFFATEKDQAELLKLIDAQALRFIPPFVPLGEQPEIHDAMHYDLGNEGALVFMLPRELSLEDDVLYEQGSKAKSKIYTLNEEESWVIGFEPAVHMGNQIERGRLFLFEDRGDRRQSLLERKYGFLSRAIQKWARADKHQGHVGPHAEGLVREGKLRLGAGKKSVGLWR